MSTGPTDSTLYTPVFPQVLIQSLLDMGFSHNQCVRGLHFTGGTSVTLAMDWILQHMDDPAVHEKLLVQRHIDNQSNNNDDTQHALNEHTQTQTDTQKKEQTQTDTTTTTTTTTTTSASDIAASTTATTTISSPPSSSDDTTTTPSSSSSSSITNAHALSALAAALDWRARGVEAWKMVFAVRADLKMRTGKVAAQVGHATLGLYQYVEKHRPELLESWYESGQAKVVLSVKNLDDMLAIQQVAQQHNIPTYIVCDAGRTQVEPGSQTVMAIGPGSVKDIDAVTGGLKLL